MKSGGMLRRSKMSRERAIALDELIPDKSAYYDSAPGVYVRSDKDNELDVLWQGFKINHREEKSPGFYLVTGFIIGVVCTIIMTLFFNLGTPTKDNLADLNLWKKASTKTANVNIAPSTPIETTEVVKITKYKVKSGDTLGAIAYKFYGTVNPAKIAEIQKANNLKSPNALQVNKTLIIPMEN